MKTPEVIPTCPGMYCGRTLVDKVWSDCGACPKGFRANATSYCEQCLDDPALYDWLYIGFMVLLPLVLHWFFIDLAMAGRSKAQIIATHFCALIEVSLGVVISLYILEPEGSFGLTICTPKALSDWYTLFHNPRPDYKEKLYCTQEAVYPLYSSILMMYIYSLVIMIFCRPWLVKMGSRKSVIATIYCALYFYPVIIAIHAIAAGLIYYSFPYMIIILSMMSSASHFSVKEEQTSLALFMSCFKDPRNTVILLGHWLLHAYGLISITGLKDPVFHGLLICLVPAPALFYILTAPFTDPNKLHYD